MVPAAPVQHPATLHNASHSCRAATDTLNHAIFTAAGGTEGAQHLAAGPPPAVLAPGCCPAAWHRKL